MDSEFRRVDNRGQLHAVDEDRRAAGAPVLELHADGVGAGQGVLVGEAGVVAAGAHLRRLYPEQRRARILDVVDPVTVRAHRGERQESLLEQGLAVDALDIFVVRHFAVNIVFQDDSHILVAG